MGIQTSTYSVPLTACGATAAASSYPSSVEEQKTTQVVQSSKVFDADRNKELEDKISQLKERIILLDPKTRSVNFMYWGELQNGQAYGRGTWRSSNGNVYFGSFSIDRHELGPDSICEGEKSDLNFLSFKGTLSYPDRTRVINFKGECRDGLPWKGRGVTNVFEESSLEICEYSGDVECGVPHGQGVLTWNNGEQFKGEFNQGLFWEGVGVVQRVEGEISGRKFNLNAHLPILYTRPRTWVILQSVERKIFAVYSGTVKQGKLNGHGVLKFQDESVSYIGEFKDGKFEGEGKLVFDRGYCTEDKYKGRFVEGKRCGYGVIRLGGGLHYEGNFQDDEKHGYGIERTSGGVYTGGFERGYRHGDGLLRLYDGREYPVQYESGTFVGQGFIEYESGEAYTGMCRGGLPHGKGTLRYRNGLTFTGTFVNGEIEGFGTLIYPNQKSFEGEFSSMGKLHESLTRFVWTGTPRVIQYPILLDGVASIQYPSGDEYIGFCKGVNPHGRGVYKWKSLTSYVSQGQHAVIFDGTFEFSILYQIPIPIVGNVSMMCKNHVKYDGQAKPIINYRQPASTTFIEIGKGITTLPNGQQFIDIRDDTGELISRKPYSLLNILMNELTP